MKTVYDPVPESNNKAAFKLGNHVCWSTIVTLVENKFEISLFDEDYYILTKLNKDFKKSCLDSSMLGGSLSLTHERWPSRRSKKTKTTKKTCFFVFFSKSNSLEYVTFGWRVFSLWGPYDHFIQS